MLPAMHCLYPLLFSEYFININNFNIIVFVIGIAIVAILQFVGNKKEAKAIQ